MTERELLRRIQALEAQQREHYASGRDSSGDAVSEAICILISEARIRGLCAPDGRPLAGRLEEGPRHGHGSRP